MKKIKLLTGILSVMLFVALVPTLKTKAESLRENDESDVVVDVSNWESQSVNNQDRPSDASSSKLHEVNSLNSVYYTTKGGHQVEITDSGIYVDGAYVNLNWSMKYNINYTRIQNFTITSSTKVDASSYQNGTFIDGQNMNSSSDCIRVKINNFDMEYFCNSPYESWDKHFGESSWTYFYIDANTGKTIGTDANYYHTNMGIRNRFSKF